MKKFYLLLLTTILTIKNSQAQSPAEFDLIICNSTDGINWTNNTLFQDSSGVPSVTQHSTGVLYTAFQWFPAPATGTNTSWDKIAIKKSTDILSLTKVDDIECIRSEDPLICPNLGFDVLLLSFFSNGFT